MQGIARIGSSLIVRVIVIAAPAVLTGCVSLAVGAGADALYSTAFRIKIVDVSRLPPAQFDDTRSVLLFASSAGLDYLDKGPVAGLACKLSVAPLIPKFFWHPPLSDEFAPSPEDAARLQMKIKAVQAGANAVIEPQCFHKDGIDWGNDCFDSWICRGRAVVVR